jgi:two-component system chemotaxis sensor kinase CheA
VGSFDELPLFSLVLATDRAIDEVRRVASVDGVEAIEIDGGTAADSKAANEQTAPSRSGTAADVPVAAPARAVEQAVDRRSTAPATLIDDSGDPKSQVVESIRVDIDRLDELLNLTGELVVAQARFAQIADAMSPMLRRGGFAHRSRDVFNRLRERLSQSRPAQADASKRNTLSDDLNGLQEDLHLLDEQSALWEDSREYLTGVAEATDQLLRVSRNLQRCVLNTRMVPVGPLFNRFRRVVRDLSVSRGKRVQLSIAGEKTELDKRMIDALGDPLLHLVRNSIDHGLESAEVRRAAGKDEVGTVSLEAVHRGNNVLIMVRDDGGGINLNRIRERVVERGLVPAAQVRELSDHQLLDYIWHPGFSTAETVTEISGRGVGMDIVHSAIAALSGTIDAASTPGAGTTFTIRLPLTLAIIHSLLIRFRDGCFSIPIDDVREIVSVSRDQVHSAHRYLTIDVRGELIPLMDMAGVFAWQRSARRGALETADGQSSLNVVVLQSRGKTLGLSVDSLVGRADIVVKSLSENFMPVRGLSGASILGDGSVSLMLDPAALIELASERATAGAAV